MAARASTGWARPGDFKRGHAQVVVHLQFPGQARVEVQNLPSESWEWRQKAGESAPYLGVFDLYDSTDPDLARFSRKLLLEQVQQAFRPSYTVDGQTIEYRLKGFSRSFDSREVVFSPDAVVDSDQFEDLDGSTPAYDLWAIWDGPVVVRFQGGYVSGVTGSMQSQLVETGVATRLNPCTYSIEKRQSQFTYHENGLWKRGKWDPGQSLNLVKFDHWNYSAAGVSIDVGDEGNILIPEDTAITRPVVTLTANWSPAHNSISFYVLGQRYCDVLVSSDDDRLVHPERPELVDEDTYFVGWELPDGCLLQGISHTPVLICGTDGNPVVCGSQDNPLVCEDQFVFHYAEGVNAQIGSHQARVFTVCFRWVDDNGNWTETRWQAMENSHLPGFRIKSSPVIDGVRHEFRYWRLESGDVTSSQTILSDVVYAAVYDEVGELDSSSAGGLSSTVVLADPVSQGSPSAISCPYVSSGLNRDGRHYCTLTSHVAIDPLDGVDNLVKACCVWLNGQNVPKEAEDDFSELTLLQSADVVLLVQALFKVNIYIANHERYLKVAKWTDEGFWYGYVEDGKWVSFEPTVEWKFSNLHALNQPNGGRLLCSRDMDWGNLDESKYPRLVPIYRDLLDEDGFQWNDEFYLFDHHRTLLGTEATAATNGEGHGRLEDLLVNLDGQMLHYRVYPLCLYENTALRDPRQDAGFIRHRLKPIQRTRSQVQTFATVVKKYRPVVMPSVETVFGEGIQKDLGHELTGWRGIPSKPSVDMQTNEGSVVVPSSYGCHNRVGSSDFLQLDPDLDRIWGSGGLDSIQDSWAYLYDSRDWTYFMEPFFGVGPNFEVASAMGQLGRPIGQLRWCNGTLFEPSLTGRSGTVPFGQQVLTCRFLAARHHGQGNLRLLAERHVGLLSYSQLQDLTKGDEFNDVYGSKYEDLPQTCSRLDSDWVDDFDMTSMYLNLRDPIAVGPLKYPYNLGQRAAVDDWDDSSVWFYLVVKEKEPETQGSVEIQDVMPFVFWWSNRGEEGNGPTVDCYGLRGNSRRNGDGVYCHESPIGSDSSCPEESRWHAVQTALGVDFSQEGNGGVVVAQNNSGNVYKGYFDPTCVGTDEKWKTHSSSAFGTPQHQDPPADKYRFALKANGEDGGQTSIPSSLNREVMASLQDKPMTWNLWNVVRHWVYLREWSDQGRVLTTDADWTQLEARTEALVRSMYSTYCDGSARGSLGGQTIGGGRSSVVRWTSSFLEIQSILDRNAREHEASLVVFTGNSTSQYSQLRQSVDNFVVQTLEGVVSTATGMRPDDPSLTDDQRQEKLFHGHLAQDLPLRYSVGSISLESRGPDVDVALPQVLDLDSTYPSAEAQWKDPSLVWNRKVYAETIHSVRLPLYTSMETMTDDDGNQIPPSQATVAQLKSITFQVIPQLYWRNERGSNDLHIHPVGLKQASFPNLPFWDMLGNVWEYVRDDWSGSVSGLNGRTNPIVGTTNPDGSPSKVIRGGAFDQFARSCIAPTRQAISMDMSRSIGSNSDNVGFRPALTYQTPIVVTKTVTYIEPEPEPEPEQPEPEYYDLFFLFDASGSATNFSWQMENSAREIVKKYASESDPNICRVGSGLFLGENVRFQMFHQFYSKTVKEMNLLDFHTRSVCKSSTGTSGIKQTVKRAGRKLLGTYDTGHDISQFV